MTNQKTFLIRATFGHTTEEREAVMRLPIDRYGGITSKGYRLIGERFFDGITQTPGSMKYALCLEAFTTGDSLMAALEKYKKNLI